MGLRNRLAELHIANLRGRGTSIRCERLEPHGRDIRRSEQ